VLASFFFSRWLGDLSEGPSDLAPAAVPPDDDPTVSIHTVDDRYTLLEQIGSGAAATVYRARDTLLDTVVALKLLRTEATGESDTLERVRQEILLPRDLAHPNVLRVYDLGSSGGAVYLTMRLIEGRTLADTIGTEAPLDPGIAVTIARKVASALAAAHRLNVLHRDIKPGNILLDADNEPYLADFGLARLIEGPSITVHGHFMGTPSYASPEQATVKPLDERSDLYSLGVVLFEMVTGRRPFEADSVAEVLEMQRTAVPTDPRTIVPATPDRLAETILRCLAKDPADRFQTAEDLQAELDELKS
jgi:serine/threonine-protein kinase